MIRRKSVVGKNEGVGGLAGEDRVFAVLGSVVMHANDLPTHTEPSVKSLI